MRSFLQNYSLCTATAHNNIEMLVSMLFLQGEYQVNLILPQVFIFMIIITQVQFCFQDQLGSVLQNSIPEPLTLTLPCLFGA